MHRSILAALLAAWALCFCLPVHALDGYATIGIGAALNNNEPYREETKDECGYKGQLVDLGVVWKRSAGPIDARLNWTYVMCSIFGTEQAVTLTFTKPIGNWHAGAGLVLGYRQAYETWEKEYLGSDGYDPLHPADRRECMACGITVQAGYEYKRVQFQVRYWRTDFNIYPGHNGALIVVAVRL